MKQKATAATQGLTYQNISFLKDETRFKKIELDGFTFLFDQRTSEIYMLDESIIGLLSAESELDFPRQLGLVPPEELDPNIH